MSESTEKTRYLPEELPNHLFTQKKLSQLGLVPRRACRLCIISRTKE
jgi:hypothetical protein